MRRTAAAPAGSELEADDGYCPQGASFKLEGRDEDGCVWLISGEGQGATAINLGPRQTVAGRMADWLAEIDFEEG